VHVSRASSVSVVDTNFTNCSVTDTASGDVVSGGAAVSAALTRDVSVYRLCFRRQRGVETRAEHPRGFSSSPATLRFQW